MKCVICLPIYNVENYLDKIFSNLLEINKLFIEFSIIFGYDHSKDKSLEKLEKFKLSNNNLEIEILINNNKRFKYRTHNLAFIRNLMIKLVYEKYSNYDFFIMMDSDDVCSQPINYDILKKHLVNDTWDSLSFNKKDYYDIWALQYEPFIHHCRCFGENSWPIINYIKNDISNRLRNLKEDDYFEVYSAFNGFAIYKLNKFINCKYDGIRQKYFDDNKINNMIEFLNNSKISNIRKKIILTVSKENCEHISFHIDSINKNNAKIMISKDILFN